MPYTGIDLEFTTPKKTDFVSGQLRTETCSTAKKTKKVLLNLAAKDRKQNELIRKLKEDILKLKKEIADSSAEKKRNKRLLETVEQKLELEAKRANVLEQQLAGTKERERHLKSEIQQSSEKLTQLNEFIKSKTFDWEQDIANYQQELLSKDCTLEKLKRELQKSEAANSDLLNQIQKLKDAKQQENPDHDKAVVSIMDSYQKRCEAVSKEYKLMEKENLKRWQNERSHLEEEFDKRTLCMEVQCAEKDNMLKQKELMFEEFRAKQENLFTSMKADMEDLRAELSNQIKINGKIKMSYEDLRVGTNLKIRSLERKTEGLKNINFLMPSNSEDIRRIQRILAIGCSETDVTLKIGRSPNTPMPTICNPEIMPVFKSEERDPIIINPEPRHNTLKLRNSPSFNRSLRSTLRRKRAFWENECMTENSKRRRTVARNIRHKYDGQNRVQENAVRVFGADDSTFYSCALM